MFLDHDVLANRTAEAREGWRSKLFLNHARIGAIQLDMRLYGCTIS